jgi:alkylhydroperoxidase family enzyme
VAVPTNQIGTQWTPSSNPIAHPGLPRGRALVRPTQDRRRAAVARLLAWYPKAAFSSGVVEALIAHGDGQVTERMMKMVRMAVSFSTSCPFCVGLNSERWGNNITEDELHAVQRLAELSAPTTISDPERLAIEFARLRSLTPLNLTPAFGVRLREAFSEREIVILATTSAHVNYWARLIQGLGCPAANQRHIPDISSFQGIVRFRYATALPVYRRRLDPAPTDASSIIFRLTGTSHSRPSHLLARGSEYQRRPNSSARPGVRRHCGLGRCRRLLAARLS